MTIIEMRLAGRQTTAAGIARALHPLLDRGPIARVELRLSTQTTPRLDETAVRNDLRMLLRERGHAAAAVSVRPHEGALDDATGEHLLRVKPAEARPIPMPVPVPPSGLRRWLQRWLPRGLARWLVPEHIPAGAVRVDPGLAAQGPATAPRPLDPKTVTEAVKKLREAVLKAVDFVETPNGTELVGQVGAAQAVGTARITVRLDSLHRALEPLVRKDTNAIAQMVQSGGLATTPDFRVEYGYMPPHSGSGTSYAHESDIEVRLFLAGAKPAVQPGSATVEAAAPTTGHASAPMPLHSLRPDMPPALAEPDHTALPATPLPAVPALTVRVLGTMDGLFARPFELHFDRLPARLDRSALHRAGFGQQHPDLLVVASNSCPLTFSETAGQVWMHAATWADQMGVQTPMYFDRRTMAGLFGDSPVKAGGTGLVVNAPSGVRDPASGRLLPALVVELLPAGSRPDGSGATLPKPERAD